MLKLATAPASEPITVAEAKSHLRVDISTDDTLIGVYITAARQVVETYTRRQLVEATWDLWLDRFPSGNEFVTHGGAILPDLRGDKCGHILLPLPPVSAVSFVKYYDTADTLTTLATTSYQSALQGEPARVLPAYGMNWPTTRDRAEAVNVRFVAGYGAAAAVPESAKQAIKLLVGHFYENRESVNVGNIVSVMPLAIESLCGHLAWGGYA